MATKIKLPRIFTEKVWERCNSREDWKQYIGCPAVSYSQLTSFKDYQNDAYLNYFFGLGKDKEAIFMEFGSMAGSFIETAGKEYECGDYMTDDSMDALMQIVDENKEHDYQFERPVLIPIQIGSETVVMYGFVDRWAEEADCVGILDYKTGSIEKKSEFYQSDEYWQTRLYAYAAELEEYRIVDCGVLILDRKGNSKPLDNKPHPLRLTGETIYLHTPYNKAETEKYINDKIVPQIKAISDMYKSYLKMFGE